MKTPRACACLTILMSATLATPGHAQQADSPDEPARVEIKGSSAQYNPRRDDTATRTIVGRDELLRYGDSSLLDALRRVPGITVDSSAGRGGDVRMRGLGGGYTQILVNGERAPSGFSIDSLAPDAVERVEVLRAATADLPTQSVAGTINIVLRHVARTRERELKLGMMHSSVFKGPNAALQLSQRREGFAWSLAADGNTNRFHRTSSGALENRTPDGILDLQRSSTIPEQGRMAHLSLTPRLEWTLAGGDTVTSSSFINLNRFRNRAQNLVTTLLGNPPPVPDLTTRMHSGSGEARTDLAWTRGFPSGTTLEAKLGLTAENGDARVLRRGLDDSGVLATDGSIDETTRDRGVNSTGKLLRAAMKGHALAAGWDGALNWRDETRQEADAVRVFAPGVALDEAFSARVSRLALYAQDEWNINPQWSMYLGLRWEGIRLRASGNSFDATRSDASVWSPIMHTLWKIPGSKGDQLRLAVTRTYKAPALQSLLPRRREWENNSPTEADTQGNPNLEPELAWGIDGGYEHYWAENAMVSLSASLRRIDDYTSNRVFFNGRRWVQIPVNDGRAEVRSLELETKFPLKSLFAGAPAIDVRGGVSRHWSRVESVPWPYNRLERQSPLSANLGLDYVRGKLSLGASAAFVRNGQVRIAANRGFYSEARTDMEAYGAWRFDQKRQMRLSLSNLLREDDGFGLSYADPVSGVEQQRFRFKNPLQVKANYEVKF